MKRHFDETVDDTDEQPGSDVPRSRASGYTDQALESRFSSASSKAEGKELMDEATIKEMMKKERLESKREASPKKKKASRWENRRVSVDDAPVDGGSLLRSPSPPPRKSSRWGQKLAEDTAVSVDVPPQKPSDTTNNLAENPETDVRASAGAAASLSPGDLVSLKGLQAAAHLNGQKGRLVRLDPSTGRWEVRLLATIESKAIKPENIELEDSDDEDGLEASDAFVPPKSPEPAESEPPVAPKSPPLSAHTPPALLGKPLGGVAGLTSISQIGAVGLPTVAQRFDAIPLAKKRTSSKPARQMGTIRWYNGRRKLGVVIADAGGKDLYIPAQGASNGSQVPPQPGGLFHGTRVSFVPQAIKAESTGGSSSSAEKKIVCMDVRALAGQTGLTVGVDTFVGGKEKNDDRIAAMDLHELGFLAGIFDGHLGHNCADFVSKHVPPAVLTAYRARVKKEGGPGGSISKLTHAHEARLIEKAFVDAFEEVDKTYLVNAKKKEWKDGSTAVVALVCHGFEVPVAPTTAASLWPPEKNAAKQIGTVVRAPGGVAKLFCAWCGDSRGVLLRGRQGLRCTEDHRPNRRDEQNRVKAVGAMVAQDSRGIWRVGPRRENKYAKELEKKKKGSGLEGKWFLSTSRSFGDPTLKAPDPIVIATPEVKVIDLVPEDWAVIIGSDGIFDKLTDQGVADVLWKAMAVDGLDPVAAAKEVVQAAFRAGSKDNLTAVVMRLGWAASPTADGGNSTLPEEKKKDQFDMFG